MKTKQFIKLIVIGLLTVSVIGLTTSNIVMSNDSTILDNLNFIKNNDQNTNRKTSDDWVQNLSTGLSNYTLNKNSLIDTGSYKYNRYSLTFKYTLQSTNVSWSSPSVDLIKDEMITNKSYDDINYQIDYKKNIIDIPNGEHNLTMEELNFSEEGTEFSPNTLLIINKSFATNTLTYNGSSLSSIIESSDTPYSSQFTGLDVFSDSNYYYLYLTENYGDFTFLINRNIYYSQLVSGEYDPLGMSNTLDENMQFYDLVKNASSSSYAHTLTIIE